MGLHTVKVYCQLILLSNGPFFFCQLLPWPSQLVPQYFLCNFMLNEPCCEKTNVLVYDQVRHKPGFTAIEDGKRLEFSD